MSIEWNKKYKLNENFIDKVARHVTEASDTLLIIHKNSIVIFFFGIECKYENGFITQISNEEPMFLSVVLI